MENIIQASEVLFKGMAGIFIALAVVYVSVIILVKMFPSKPSEQEEND